MPRALRLSGLLNEFFTDLWTKRLRGRFHRDLANAQVTAPNLAALTFELKASLAGKNGWHLISRRNKWFQRQAVMNLKRRANGDYTIFAYSYAAKEIFKFAKDRGWRAVLGQIDPGPAEERVVADLQKRSPIANNHWEPPAAEYWNDWRTECELADEIVVNSRWSRNALLGEGIPAQKLRVVPVAYESDSRSSKRHYPTTFTHRRPLRVLFLGQINLRKGVEQLLDAVQLMSGEHVEFWFVGPTQIRISQELKLHPQLRWFGVAPRVDVDNYYRDADVFILPTLSDGFGLTQLEAQSWKLPVVASRCCGEVINDGVNGVILEEVSGKAIADTLRKFMQSPDQLCAMSDRSVVDDRFSLKTLARSLQAL